MFSRTDTLAAFDPELAQAIPAAIALHLCFLVCAVVAGMVALLLTRLKPAPATR